MWLFGIGFIVLVDKICGSRGINVILFCADTTNDSSPLSEVEEDTIVQKVRIDLVKLNDTNGGT